VPVDVTVLTDDLAYHSDMTISSDNFVPGTPMRIQARITEFGRPVLNIGGSAGGRAVVQLLRPGMSVGDLLSNNQATGTPNPNDPGSAADAKLAALLQQQPQLFQKTTDMVTLVDGGTNGDEVANDGVYTALFMPQEPGHYNFLFGIEGTGQTRRFSRQQLKSVHVRPIPDAMQTMFQTVVQGTQLVITTTPKTRSGSKLGPGFANYIWFTAPGIDGVKPADNLDGTYRATLNTTTGPVAMHFVDVGLIIADSVTPANLPAGALGNQTVVIPEVPGVPKSLLPIPLWLVILLLVALIVLAFFAWKKAHP
jgi:hypothetical protein